SSYYAGIGTLLLAVAAIRRLRDRRVYLLAGLVMAALVLALGDSGKIYRVLRTFIPALGFARCPVKFTILILALVPLLAAFGLQALDRQSRKSGRFEWICALIIV